MTPIKAFIQKVKEINIACESAFMREQTAIYPQLLEQVKECLHLTNEHYQSCVQELRNTGSKVSIEDLQAALEQNETILRSQMPKSAIRKTR